MAIPRLDGNDKNFVINSGFPYWQRGVSDTNTVGSTYKADRFYLYSDVGSVGTILRTLDAPASLKSVKHCAEFALTTTPEDGNGDTHRMIHRIESIFAQELAGKPVSFYLWVKTVDFTGLKLELATPTGGADVWSGKTIIHTDTASGFDDGTWKQIKFENITLPSTVEDGLQIIVWTNGRSGAGVTNFKTTAWKLSIGTKAQDYSMAGRNLVEELQLCQRYYEKSYDVDTSIGATTRTGIASGHYVDPSQTSTLALEFEFKERKRGIPVMSFYSPGTGAVNQYSRYNSGAASSGTITSQANLEQSERGVNGYLATNVAQSQDSDYQVHWAADAEL